MKKALYTVLVSLLCLGFTACNEDDDFTESIFDTTTPAVDTTLATAPFDEWLYDNFVTPYNVEIIYRFSFPASDLEFTLTPAEYKKSQVLAHLVRYLFYDVYTEMAGEDFMKQYGPRLFHFIGSVGYNPVAGTEVLGTASGGIKITLYNVNALNDQPTWTEGDVLTVNEYYFHTMHHEFSHILHQTKSYPTTFGQVNPAKYDPLKWQERDSLTTHRLGYVTNYSSSANTEDFVETLSCIITDTDYRWMMRIINGSSVGVKSGDKEKIYTLIDSLDIDLNKAGAAWNNFDLYREVWKRDSSLVRYIPSVALANAKADAEEPDSVIYLKDRHFDTFNDYMSWVPVSSSDTITGINAIIKKIDIASKWYTDKWDLHIYSVRREVGRRQDAINDYLRTVDIYDYQ